MSTGCAFYEEALADQLSGQLSSERARELEEHLRSCADCRETRAVLKAVRDAEIRPPEGLERRIREAVRSAADAAPSGVGRGRGRRPHRSWSWRPVMVPLAAAAALVALLIGLPQGEPTVESEPLAAEEVEPYGAWPAADGAVAGDVLLSELSDEELERLLEEMES